MQIELIASVFTAVFLAELGDKTQITVACIAARRGGNMIKVFLCSLTGLIAITMLNLLIGAGLRYFIPVNIIKIASAAFFIILGVFTILRKGSEDEGEGCRPAEGAYAFLLVALMEFGDKTQLAVVSLSASTGKYLEVFTGAVLAFTLSTLIASLVGGSLRKITKYEKTINIVSGIIFIMIGIVLLIEALGFI